MAIARATILDTKELQAWLAQMTPDAVVILEALDDWRIGRVNGEKKWPPDIAKWETGHVFTEKGHSRWRREGARYPVLWIGDDETQLPAWESENLVSYAVQEFTFYLWGEQTEGQREWLDARIPRLFDYPIDLPQERVVILAMTYTNRDSGRVEFVRYRGLEGRME